MICYPTTTNTGNAIPPSTPAGNYSGSSQPAPSWHGYNSTPTYQPTGQATTKPKNTVGVINVNPGSGSTGWNRNQFLGSVTYSHNYGGFSVAPMAGYSHVPSVFKKTVKTVNPQNIGREADLTDNRYVNNTMQRVSGGRIIPLSAPPQQPIQIANRGINGLNLSQYPGSSHLANSGTMKNITVAHQILQIASSNYDLQNLSNPGSSSGFGTAGTNGFNTSGTSGAGGSGVGGFNDSFNGFTTSIGGNTAGFNRAGTNTPGSTSNIPGYNDAVFTTTPAGPPTIIPGSDIGNNPYMAGLDPNSFGRRLTSPETLISDDAPINELIDWTQDPEIEFTPKKKITNPDGTFTYVPDGPPARAKITRPTQVYYSQKTA